MPTRSQMLIFAPVRKHWIHSRKKLKKTTRKNKPKSSRMDPVLNALYPLRAHLTGARNRELTLGRDLAEAREEISNLKLAEATVRRECAEAQTTIEAQNAEIRKLKQSLADAEERYRLLDEHWQRSSATSVARKVGSLSEEVGHEVQEAILSLDRETPNLTMALNRLRRLQSIIKRQAGRDEGVAQ